LTIRRVVQSQTLAKTLNSNIQLGHK
jgi:hypothetical protein